MIISKQINRTLYVFCDYHSLRRHSHKISNPCHQNNSCPGHTHFDKTWLIQINSSHNETGLNTEFVNYRKDFMVPGGGFEPPAIGFQSTAQP